MKISDFDYYLPEELIAQKPANRRECSRLLVVHRDTGKIEHRHFYDIIDYLKAGDCLVLNNSKVLPARLYGVKEKTGAKVEFLLIKRIEGDTWETMVRPGRKLKPGDIVVFSQEPLLKATIKDFGTDGTRIVDFEYDGVFMERLEEIGSMPLPPYIERSSDSEDRDRYQTVYCKEEGSVAAPTAGLHFTEELLKKAEDKGVELVYVTLHVGIGTFRPVKCENIEDHTMHFEEYSISEESAEVINRAKREGRRIISVGTTSTRTVESAAYFDADAQTADGKAGCWQVRSGEGSTGIFIYPGYEFKIIESLITNFHLPKSTLLMLISALYDREKILAVYDEAVKQKYRFFSYGDAMFIE
ncbi:S-adenosylmethionine:tRNA ribosyltransferase-isomerase [uncultured Eubacterium sp.]|uniref:tRNA preQ1(34) S-adenosylmethionine ribosyltransferase-isomerase QueA n=1 Tax=Brotomerdimonas butyrica TaxID=2981721 RepID=UPI000822BCF9|nr:tRNA preQ1(34) S-adenosylmethionine ribosyltransferase-isomerase QueA [Brotomerdimonas butyrica]MCU6755866.1 tRNA preQ1(34) S-adenosylmethionine ribosyltransferase-isomerase QueA [Brotomerdimonas butyrica]SCH53483.1 S-adenosylmethionine:tRNA ribosyltransferase-isomerase [uncultured Eubacterium sp.]